MHALKKKKERVIELLTICYMKHANLPSYLSKMKLKQKGLDFLPIVGTTCTKLLDSMT